MVEEEFIPDPNSRVPKGIVTPWRTFLTAHANVMVATDFFCKAVWTPLGKRMAYAIMFIHVGSRKVMVSPSTFCPNEEWMRQQGRNILMWLEDAGLECHELIRDNDTKYAESFDAIFKCIGVDIVRTPFQAPQANSFAESWIAGLKRECLNHLVCFSVKQLDYVTTTYVKYFNEYRPHQSLGNVPPARVGTPPPIPIGPIRRRRILGGLLNHYERRAA
ncbi:MAG: integrase core domain-containing protein [Phycisphaeraceae bacterium]